MSEKREKYNFENKRKPEEKKPMVFDEKIPPIKSYHAVPFTNANEILPIPGGILRIDDETFDDKLR